MPVRGDIITSDRYISDAFMARENELLWPYVWHLGGMMAELQEEGDYVRHNLGTVQTQWNATARMYASTTKIESFDIVRKVLVTQESGKAIVARCAIQRPAV